MHAYSVLSTSMVHVHEGWDIVVVDAKGTSLHANVNKFVLIKQVDE